MRYLLLAAACASLISVRRQRCSMQIFMALSHRGAKAQPFGMFSRSMGVPVMGCSRVPAVSAVGMERSRPLVYSWQGL